MKKAAPHITTSLLILLVMVPFAMPFYYFFSKLSIKTEMFKLMQERPLQRVRVAAEDVVWMDKYEIWVNDQMFDIATAELKDGIYSFTGLYDKEETAIVKQQMQAPEDNAKTSKRHLVVMKWLNNACLPSTYHIPIIYISVRYIYPLQSGEIPPVFVYVVTPPPRRAA